MHRQAKLEFVREDDFVEYFLFPEIGAAQADESQLQAKLDGARQQFLDFVQAKVTERCYIWHKDEVNLQCRLGGESETLLDEESKSDGTAAKPPHLHGVTHYGENIEDEWFLVFLLTEFTRLTPGCIARICDNDGEFLLIEAEHALPKWAVPERCDQRVYIVNGTLHLVVDAPAKTKADSMTNIIAQLRANVTKYSAGQDVQACIDERLKEFLPAAPLPTLHRQIVRLPLRAAALLKQRPAIIAAAVRAFCERDSLDNKVLRTMRHFSPETQRLVRTNVLFTRCLYAMLTSTQFMPNRRSGWQLNTDKTGETYKESEIGMKISCGLEILAAQGKKCDDDDWQTSAWQAYVRSLTSKGYFRGNLEGSADYVRLLDQAKAYYKANQARFRTTTQVGTEILSLLDSCDDDAEQLRDAENNLQPSDPDDWLYVNVEELDAMLTKRYGTKKLYKPTGNVNAAEFTNNIMQFLTKESNYEGVENELDSDDFDEDELHGGKRGDDDDDDDEPSSSRAKKSSSFFDMKIPHDDWDSDSDMSGYEDECSLDNFDKEIKLAMEQMDRELSCTTVGQTFKQNSATTPDDFDDIEDFEPININANTLRNMMDSYQSQLGRSGPVPNLLHAMGAGLSAVRRKEDTNKNQNLKQK